MRDKIRLKNIRIFAYHGNSAKEREKGQIFEIDIELKCNLKIAGLTDDLKDTYDFQRIFDIVEKSSTGQNFSLIESLGEKICDDILREFPDVTVKVSIRKPEIPINAKIGYAEVEITRGSPRETFIR